jgi:hypothetical protein
MNQNIKQDFSKFLNEKISPHSQYRNEINNYSQMMILLDEKTLIGLLITEFLSSLSDTKTLDDIINEWLKKYQIDNLPDDTFTSLRTWVIIFIELAKKSFSPNQNVPGKI